MNISEYRNKYIELEQKVLNAQREFDIFKLGDHDFATLYNQEKEKHLNWLVEHLDYLQKHKEYIRKSPVLSKIVIDFLPLYTYGGLVTGVGFSGCRKYKLFLGNLLDIWDAGFCYHDCPIISYETRIHHDTDITFQYIKNNKIITQKEKISSVFKHLPELDPDIFKKISAANIESQFSDMQPYTNLSLMIDVYNANKEKQK